MATELEQDENTVSVKGDDSFPLSDAAENKKQAFLEWLSSGNAKKYSPSILVSSFDRFSEYALKKKISSVVLFEIKNRSVFANIYTKLSEVKLLRIMESKSYKAFIVAGRLYLKFLDERAIVSNKSVFVTSPHTHTSQATHEQPDDVYLIDLRTIHDLSNTKPLYFEYFSERCNIDKGWQQLYASIVQYLLRDYPNVIYGLKGKSIDDSGHICVSGFSNLVSITTPKRISNDLYLDIGFSADKIIAKIRKLLELCSVDYDNLAIYYISNRTHNKYDSRTIEKAAKQAEEESKRTGQKVSRDTAGSTSFFSWLVDEQGLSEATSRIYASAINTAEQYAQKYQIGAKQLSGTDNLSIIEETAIALLHSKKFYEYSSYRYNHIRAAMKKYLEYVGVAISSLPNFNKNLDLADVSETSKRAKEKFATKRSKYSKDAIAPNEVIKWLVTQPNANGNLYLENVARQYMYALHSAPLRLIISAPIDSRDPFSCRTVGEIDALWNTYKSAKNYKDVNKLTSGSLSAGMGCLRRYIEHINTKGNQYVPNQSNSVVSTQTEDMRQYDLTVKPIQDRLTVILSARFINGFRIDSPIELARFRTFFTEHMSEELMMPDDELKAHIMACGMSFDGKVYPVSDEAKERIRILVEDYLAGGAQAIFYAELYAKNENWLFGESVVSEEMLIEILRSLFPKLSFTHTYLGYKNVSVFSVLESEILRVWGADVLLTYDQLAERLQYIPLDRIKYALGQNGDFIWSGVETFSHISKVEVTDEECDAIRTVAIRECNARGYISITDLPFGEIEERNHELSITAIQNAVYRICLSDKLDKKGKIITRKGDIFDALTIMKEHCRTVDKCTLDDLLNYEKELTGEVHRWIPMEAGNAVLVRIDKDNYVADKYIRFNADLIDEAIELVVKRDYLPLRSFATFGAFPDCGQTWNLFLLESYCRRFSRRFRFDTLSVNSRNAGAIIRKNCGMNYTEIMTDAVSNADVPLNDSAVGRFLFDSGYTGRSTNAKVTEIIEKAKIKRESGD